MTYNQIVKEITSTLQNHAMIKEVKFCTPMEWLNSNQVPKFPVSNFVIDSGFLNIGKEQIFRIDIWFLDKSGAEGEFETDVISDMHGVAFDVLSLLRNQSKPFFISQQIQWNAVSEKFEDYLSGVKITFDLSIMRNYGACDVPTNS